MTVAYVSTATAGVGTSVTGNVSFPANLNAGEGIVLCESCKYPTGSDLPASLSGWSLVGYGRSTGLTDGVDAGNTAEFVWFRICDGTEGASATFLNQASGNSIYARMFRLTKSSTKLFAWAAVSGAMSTASSSWSVTMDNFLELIADDLILIASCFNSDVGGVSAEAISATGATFGTITERDDAGTSQGDDLRQFVATGSVSGGPATAAATYTATITTSVAGASVLCRFREIDPPAFKPMYTPMRQLVQALPMAVLSVFAPLQPLTATTPTVDSWAQVRPTSPMAALAPVGATALFSFAPLGQYVPPLDRWSPRLGALPRAGRLLPATGLFQFETAQEPTPVNFTDYVGILQSLAPDPVGYLGILDASSGALNYAGALVAADAGYIGQLSGLAKDYEYRGSLEPEEGSAMFSMIVGDRLPSLNRICYNAETGAAVDLTGGTAVSKFRIVTDGVEGTLKTGTCVITDASTGAVRFDWASDDIDAEGRCQLRAVVTIGGKTQTFPSDGSWFEFPVSAAT